MPGASGLMTSNRRSATDAVTVHHQVLGLDIPGLLWPFQHLGSVPLSLLHHLMMSR